MYIQSVNCLNAWKCGSMPDTPPTHVLVWAILIHGSEACPSIVLIGYRIDKKD